MWITFNLINEYTQTNKNASIWRFKAILGTLHDLDVITKDMPRSTEFEQINFFYYA
jgi:hypothetical protein